MWSETFGLIYGFILVYDHDDDDDDSRLFWNHKLRVDEVKDSRFNWMLKQLVEVKTPGS